MSNGILNIYKGHKSAVTCLYIYKSDVGVNKELMYSGSLDGTLRCYNIMVKLSLNIKRFGYCNFIEQLIKKFFYRLVNR